jgi:selenocysteine lyase/cysteine desulfurase
VQSTLYLDTARLGKMSPRALDASIDFARFACDHGCTVQLSTLLRDGFLSWPTRLQDEYCGLADWGGVLGFKDQLRQLTNANSDSEVMLASRSASLMKFAARLFTGPCNNVLVTDNAWPVYRRILERECLGTATRTTMVPILQSILQNSATADEVIRQIVGAYLSERCDGLFLPLVDNLGVRLPIGQIVAEIRAQSELRFVVVDAAQAIGHVPIQLADNYCDFMVAGSHKWLRAFATMGLGFYGHPSSRDYIKQSLKIWTRQGAIDDPLLSFSEELGSGTSNAYGETVQVAPLLVASAAVTASQSKRMQDGSQRNFQNRQRVAELCQSTAAWQMVQIDDAMTSQIQLLSNPSLRGRTLSVESFRAELLRQSVAATPYSNGLLRLSLPDDLLSFADCEILAAALQCDGTSGYHNSST